MKTEIDKTTIILGAGFSKYSKYPLQHEILSNLKSFFSRTGLTLKSKKNWNLVNDFFEEYIGTDIEKYLIEDLFTILDKCLIEEEYYKYCDLSQIDKIKTALIFCIRDYFNQITNDKFEEHFNRNEYNYMTYFSEVVLEKRQISKNNDQISIISLNWDCLLERFLQYYSVKYDQIQLDYCTYDYSFNNKKTVPSILKKSSGIPNLKILKPHGSTNWGYCPNCKRLYISFGRKMTDKSGMPDSKYECIKYCNKKYKKNVPLHPVLITPTFLKDMGNSHLKNIWSMMGIEVSEATNIIIIGYSLRAEDFYFRFLLSKFVNRESKIFIFDFEKNPNLKEAKKAEIYTRFQNFFQRYHGEPFYINVDGWEKSIDKIREILNLH